MGDHTHHSVLYTLSHGNEASQSHHDFEAPTQKGDQLTGKSHGATLYTGYKGLFQNLDLISVYSTLTTIGGKSNGEDRT